MSAKRAVSYLGSNASSVVDSYMIWEEVHQTQPKRLFWHTNHCGRGLPEALAQGLSRGWCTCMTSRHSHSLYCSKGSAETSQDDRNIEIDRAIALYETDKSSAMGVHRASNDVISVGQVPSCLLSILVDCPDLIDGMSSDDWRRHDDETIAKADAHGLASLQRLLLMTADREACEKGWVYLVAVNHRGQVLPTRARVHAAKAQHYAVEWYNEGIPLSELSAQDSEEIVHEQTDSGWGDW